MEFLPAFLDKNTDIPLYQQLYKTLAAAMREGELKPGEKLPGKRTAAAQLGVSINTVDQAYQMLAAEGYVEARPRSGFVVSRAGQLVPPPAAANSVAALQPLPEQKYRYNLTSSGIDTSLFPRKTWNRLMREVLAQEGDLFSPGQPQGDLVLREAITAYLRSYRGVRCEAGQIVVGAGLEVLVGMLARLFPFETLAVENPGYGKTAKVVRNEGVKVTGVPVDGKGIRPDALRASGASLAYLTPSHHFPTGAVMPVSRRTELLHWAAEGNLIIEDDYDSEFRFDGRPLPSLQGLDTTGRVVYAGTFSRSLAPGIRAAYLVLPHWLCERWTQVYGGYACTVWRPEQHTLSRLMEGGHFARTINRSRAQYKIRRDALYTALRARLPKAELDMVNRHTGLYFPALLPGREAAQIAAAARGNGIRVHAISEYQHGPDGALDGLVLGYGGLAEQDVQPAANALCDIIHTF